MATTTSAPPDRPSLRNLFIVVLMASLTLLVTSTDWSESSAPYPDAVVAGGGGGGGLASRFVTRNAASAAASASGDADASSESGGTGTASDVDEDEMEKTGWILNTGREPTPFDASDEARAACLRRLRESPSASSGTAPTNVHDVLAARLRVLAARGTCARASAAKFVVKGAPHFGGGRRLVEAELASRGWTQVEFKGASAPMDDVSMVVASCMQLRDPRFWNPLQAPGRLISAAPGERGLVLKRPFFWALTKRFTELGCDYRTFHPETYMVEQRDQCLLFLREVGNITTAGGANTNPRLWAQQRQRNNNRASSPNSTPSTAPAAAPTTQYPRAGPDDVWFLKTRVESFGRGLTIASTAEAIEAVHACNERVNFFVQRGERSILRYDGRMTQGRAYLLVSSYAPLTGWFLDGYVNVAGQKYSARPGASDEEVRAALVANAAVNAKQRRLLPGEFLSYLINQQGYSMEQVMRLRAKAKQAAMNVLLSLSAKLGTNWGSYTLFGFDYLYVVLPDGSLGVKVLESNCNCELFDNAKAHGNVRVRISASVVSGMYDAVLATNLNRAEFKRAVVELAASPDLADPSTSLELDWGLRVLNSTRSWELIYSSDPPFSVVPPGQCH